MHAVARTGVCPNFSPGDLFIIIEKIEENSGEEYPVTSSTVAGEPVCWERSAQDATVTTNVSDSGLEIRTEHWEKDSNENSSSCVKTSRGRSDDCCATSSCTISEDSGMLPLGPAIIEEQSIDQSDITDKAGCFDERTAATSPPVAANGDGYVMMENEREDMKSDDKCKIFGRLSESVAIAEEPEVNRSSYQGPDSSQVVSFDPSSAAGAEGLQAELKKNESEVEEMKNGPGGHFPVDDDIGDGVRRDQPTLTATTAPQALSLIHI